MTKDSYLLMLRSGLAGLPAQEIDDIVADYAAHFAESEASGRNETEVAAALGDPGRIARELRADVGLRRFESHWSLANLVAAGTALAGLAVVDILFLLPLLIVAIFVTVGVAIALVVSGAVGVKIVITTLLFHLGGPILPTLARLLIGAGLMSCLLGGGALLLMGFGAGIRTLGYYARLHFQLAQVNQGRRVI